MTPDRSDPMYSSYWRDTLAERDAKGDARWGVEGHERRSMIKGLIYGIAFRRYWHIAATPAEYPHIERLRQVFSRLHRIRNSAMDLCTIRQIRSVALLAAHAPPEVKAALVIGDGHGIATSALMSTFPDATVYAVNLPENLAHDTATADLHARTAEGPVARFVPVDASRFTDIAEPVQVAMNVSSMQEMSLPVIHAYVNFLRARGGPLFYCCNRVEKTHPDGTVIRFEDYGWADRDQVILDRSSPWTDRWLNLRRLRFEPYDGTIRERLVHLAPQADGGSAEAGTE